jgi:hypothetical protein
MLVHSPFQNLDRWAFLWVRFSQALRSLVFAAAKLASMRLVFFFHLLSFHSFIHCLERLSSPPRHWLWCFSDIVFSFFGLDWLSLLSAATAWPAHDP